MSQFVYDNGNKSIKRRVTSLTWSVEEEHTG